MSGTTPPNAPGPTKRDLNRTGNGVVRSATGVIDAFGGLKDAGIGIVRLPFDAIYEYRKAAIGTIAAGALMYGAGALQKHTDYPPTLADIYDATNSTASWGAEKAVDLGEWGWDKGGDLVGWVGNQIWTTAP